LLVSVVLGVVDGVMTSTLSDSLYLGSIYSIAIIIPSLAVTIRRLHDINRSGWWLLALTVFWAVGAFVVMGMAFSDLAYPEVFVIGWAVIAQLVWLVFIVALCLRGTRGNNRFGPDPLAGEK
jgi:uncharacterized membrane protein YhaH (DUF805 family)